MTKIICINNPPGTDKVEKEKDLCIGDIVEVFDGGHQYTTYDVAYRQLWGNTKNDRIDYHFDNIPDSERVKSNVIGPVSQNRWKVVNMIAHHQTSDILLHLRSRDWRNCLIGIDGVRVIRRAKNRPEVIEIDRINNANR